MRPKPGDVRALAVLLAVLAFWYGLLALLGGGGDPAVRAEELRTARTMSQALDALKQEAASRGVVPDPALDPNQTGLVGLPFSPITTTLGSLSAKRTGLQPDAAALMARLLREAGLRPGGLAAVDTSGSFPGFAIATLIAAENMGAETVCIASLGASTYGANRPEFTIADMLNALVQRGILRKAPAAVSPGGDDDLGRNIEGPELEAALARTGAEVLREKDFARNVQQRKSILSRSRRPDVLVSVGGNWAAAGPNEAMISRVGVLRPTDFPKGAPGDGLIQSFLKDGVPVVRILDVQDLCARSGLAYDPIPWPEHGKSQLYKGRPHGRLLVITGPVIAILLALAVRLRSRRVGWRIG